MLVQRARLSKVTESSALPSPSTLLCALGGQHVHGPVSRWARELTVLHRRRREGAGRLVEIDGRRAELADRINTWATLHLPSAAVGVRLHEASLGEVIDRMAAVAERAFHLLMHDDPGGERMHAAWTRLAELEIAYAELVREVGDGRRGLPPMRLGADG
ncbi:hypothetical protein OHA40_07035 [Nocardia sp. NBC_00508]|uniref:hypothetical protein n=1 Tax=Nocardia sp. NBC_00508 TaxID=2975992 RepID=UPI002E7FD5F5|nr:hypothetical protein [Nocardia sp. NBC_00508]WUD67874.1 hypothetical protein OHA40_07035 [Nocardia sp. NBC_00508]